MTLEELGERIDAAADREPHDKPHLDKNLQRISAEEVLERVRALERRDRGAS